MFKKNDKEARVKLDEIETIIGPSVKIEGNFNSNGNMMISGIVSGTLFTAANLRVEEQANINADISAKEAIIAGSVNGNMTIKHHLEILSTAKITGDITTGSLSIQQGAVLNGKCVMSDSVKESAGENLYSADAGNELV